MQTYPNPISTEMNIVIEQNILSSEKDDTQPIDYHIILYAVDGKELINSTTQGNTLQLKTSQFANGIYFLKVSNAYFSKTIRIVIEH